MKQVQSRVDNNIFRNGKENKFKNELNKINEDIIKHTHENLLGYYKKHKNLNFYLWAMI